jgi:hypothetical protein
MIISTTDPVTLHEVSSPETHPFVIEGRGENILKIYFESEENRRTYLGLNEKLTIPPASNVMPFHRKQH